MQIRPATQTDRTALIALMRRASLLWDDTRADLLANPDAIDVPPGQIAANQVFLAESATGQLLGFAVVLPRPDGDAELDGLFTDPAHMRRGTGTALVAAAIQRAQQAGARHLHVTANRNALAFYQRNGFAQTGTTRTQFAEAPLMRRALSEMPETGEGRTVDAPHNRSSRA